MGLHNIWDDNFKSVSKKSATTTETFNIGDDVFYTHGVGKFHFKIKVSPTSMSGKSAKLYFNHSGGVFMQESFIVPIHANELFTKIRKRLESRTEI